jgi:hypothetical protein
LKKNQHISAGNETKTFKYEPKSRRHISAGNETKTFKYEPKSRNLHKNVAVGALFPIR